MPEAAPQRSNSQANDTEPFSDLEVYNVESLSTGNLQSRFAVAPELSDLDGLHPYRPADRDGLHPYHPRIGRSKDANGLIIVNESNLRRSIVIKASRHPGLGWIFREWTFQELKIVRLVILALTIVIIGSIVGGVVGSRQNTRSSGPTTQPPATEPTRSSNATNGSSSASLPKPSPPWLDAVPARGDAALAVPEGQYQLPLNVTSETRDCFPDSTYGVLWDCKNIPPVQISISSPFEIVWHGPLEDDIFEGNLTYGAQPPSHAFAQTQFQLVSTQFQLASYTDINSPELGIAMYFTTLFTKWVIIHEDAMPESKTKRRGSMSTLSRKSDPSNGQVVADGDRPYFCFWESTVAEFFAYVNASIPGNSTRLSPTSKNGVTVVEYPGLVKWIEKRKTSKDNTQPYCKHMSKGDGGSSFEPVTGEAPINFTEVHAPAMNNCICNYLSS